MRSVLLAFSVVVCLGGCAQTLLPANPSSTIQGEPVTAAPVFVQRAFVVGLAGTRFEFPAGAYRPAFEDADGIYFSAEAPVLMQDLLFGSKVWLGGVYVRRKTWHGARPYLVQPAGNVSLLDPNESIHVGRAAAR